MLHSPAWELWWLVALPVLGSQIFSNHPMPSWRLRAASLCYISHKHGSVMYYQQPRPFGMYLCLRLVWFWDLDVCHWMSSPHYHTLFPIQTKVIICTRMKINNCHLHCWRQGCTSATVRLKDLDDLLEKQRWDSDKQQYESFFGEVQVPHSVTN